MKFLIMKNVLFLVFCLFIATTAFSQNLDITLLENLTIKSFASLNHI